MKKFICKFTTISLFFIISFSTMADVITVYGPESMKWLEQTFKEDFKNKTGHTIKFVGIKGLIPRMVLEKNNPKSDIILGLTLVNIEQAKTEKLISQYKPENAKYIANTDFIMDDEWYVTPFDYGPMGINYNKKLLPNPPKTFNELTTLKKQLLVQDPRSATGQEILLWSIAMYGDNWKEFWKALKPAILSTTSDWDDSFAKFSSGEASMMMGYATSNAFFYADKDSNLDSFIPENGGYIYLEGAALTNKKEIKEGARKFINYLLEENSQKLLMEKNYMLPVRQIPIPSNYASIPVPNKILKLDAKKVFQNLETWKKELLEILKSE